MVGPSRRHRRGHRLALFARPLPTRGWEGSRPTLLQATRRNNEVVGRKGQGELMLPIARVFRAGLNFPPHAARVLAPGRVIALHAIGGDGAAHRRSPKCSVHLLSGALDEARSAVDHPALLAFFDHHGVTQVRWWRAVKLGERPGGPCRGGQPHPYPSNSALASCGRAALVKKGMCPSVADFSRKISRRAWRKVRLPTPQAGPNFTPG